MNIEPSNINHPLHDKWLQLVAQFEAEGCDTSDAQSLADIELTYNNQNKGKK
jgi:hypothetical protein